LAAQRNPSYHFAGSSQPLTPPSGEARETIAMRYLESIAADIGLRRSDLSGVYIAKQYRTAFNGVTHIVFRQ
jgi:hypothetical protein